MNFGYNGSKGTRLDIVDAPGRTATGSLSGVLYDYEDSVAFSNFNAFTVVARRRLHSGIALGGRYTYSHSIDDASSIGGNGGTGLTVAQNWQNLLAEESNSSFDIRHQFNGTFLYELPFGPDTHLLTTGTHGAYPGRDLLLRHLRLCHWRALDAGYASNIRTWPAAAPGRCGPIACRAFLSPQAAVRSITGSTRVPSPLRRTSTEPLRAIRFPDPVRCLSMHRSRRPFASRKHAPLRCAPPPITSSTPSNTQG